MGVFYVFLIVQMVPNRAKRLICSYFENILDSNLGITSIIENIISTYIKHPLEN